MKLNLKINGTKEDIVNFQDFLERHFNVVEASSIMPNDRDKLFHKYVILLPKMKGVE